MTTVEEKKPVVLNKPKSPFSGDPYNNRGGKGGVKNITSSASDSKIKKSSNVQKFKKGGSGDR